MTTRSAPRIDPTSAGTPDFVSIQEFFDLLDTATFDSVTGADIGVDNVGLVGDKLAFDINLSRSAPGAVPLNGAGAVYSGGGGTVTFGAGTLTDSDQAWEENQFAGHHVVAGTSAGTIASNTASSLTLDANGWTPTQPADGAAYVISGMQGDVGTVQLGDELGGGGIRGANGVNATAEVTPSYDATITLVLDLQPPTLHDPPIEVSNPDGTTYLASCHAHRRRPRAAPHRQHAAVHRRLPDRRRRGHLRQRRLPPGRARR